MILMWYSLSFCFSDHNFIILSVTFDMNMDISNKFQSPYLYIALKFLKMFPGDDKFYVFFFFLQMHTKKKK